jgi:hypothetical protein
MRWIYISPHLDDAVLSAGGLIYEQARAGDRVEIWTIFSGFPADAGLSSFARSLHAEWGMGSAEQAVSARRSEDLLAARMVGAAAVHFDFLDCIYRRGANGEYLYQDVFVPPHAEEAGLAGQIVESVSARMAPGDQLVCQLAIGSHIDHVLVRRSIELAGRPLFFIQDFPYLITFPEDLARKTTGLKGSIRAVSARGLKTWQEAVAVYRSQISSLFDSAESMREQLARYHAEAGGIKLWTID